MKALVFLVPLVTIIVLIRGSGVSQHPIACADPYAALNAPQPYKLYYPLRDRRGNEPVTVISNGESVSLPSRNVGGPFRAVEKQWTICSFLRGGRAVYLAYGRIPVAGKTDHEGDFSVTNTGVVDVIDSEHGYVYTVLAVSARCSTLSRRTECFLNTGSSSSAALPNGFATFYIVPERPRHLERQRLG